MKPDVSAAVSILIVDDDRGQRSLLETFLRTQGYLTQSAASGEAVPLPPHPASSRQAERVAKCAR